MMSLVEEEPVEDEDVPEIPSLRNNCVAVGENQCDTSYNIGILEVGEPEVTVAIIAVTCLEDRVLVVLPEEAWSRKKRNRSLPSTALRKVVAVKVSSCSLLDRETPSGEPDLRVWVGLLDPELETAVTYGEDSAEIDFPGDEDQRRLPYGPALLAVCQDHFAFQTAESQVPPPPGLNPPPLTTVEARLEKMEEMILQLTQGVSADCPVTLRPKAKTSRPAALRKPAEPATALPSNIDAAIAQQALQSGVSPAVLTEMSQIVGPQGLGKNQKPRHTVPAVGNSEDEAASEEDPGDAGALDGSDPMQAAVLQLTKLVSHLSEDRIRKKDKGLESLLDRAEGGGSAKESGSYSRSRAAALRTLQKTLKSNPVLLYRALEANMLEDWEDVGNLPGLGSSTVSARGWMEHRSRIQAYPAAIRSGWALAGIWDSLRGGRHDEARARAGLALAALDQQACDRGSYLLAAEVAMEAPPPYSSFQNHSAPEPFELPHSKLLDPRWVELMMSKLKDLSEYQEKKLKLSAPKKIDDPDKPPKIPPKPTPKKGQGKGKEGKDGKGEREPPAQAA